MFRSLKFLEKHQENMNSKNINIEEYQFKCLQCGHCCQQLSKAPAYRLLDRGDGTCRYYSMENQWCCIYDSRPIECRIDEFYEKNMKNIISRKNYFFLTEISCRVLQSNFLLKEI